MFDNAAGLISLTGDRPTGRLHLGHYAGSLRNRINIQNSCKMQYIMIADLQAMVNRNITTKQIKLNSIELMKDYISVGLAPEKNAFILQSLMTPLHELVTYYSTLTTLSDLQKNPTIKQELSDDEKFNHAYQSSFVSMHFFMHPISQAADITGFGADIVPIGEDQLPLIYQTNDIIDRFNNQFGATLKRVKPILSSTPRLPGIDGKAKASKSLNNAIFLSDDTNVVRQKVYSMYTDPKHIHVDQPGNIEGNVVFEYLDAFHRDVRYVQELKNHYKSGGLGDVKLKAILFETIESILTPIRSRRSSLSDELMHEILKNDSYNAIEIVNETLSRVKQGIGFLMD